MEYFHETIKVPKHLLAWVYLQSENNITEVKKHWHRSIEISYILHGTCLFEINGQTFEANQNDIIIINSCDVHGCQTNYHSQSEMISIIFPYDFLKNVFGTFNNYNYSIEPSSEYYQRILDEFKEVYTVFVNRESNPLYQLKLNGFFYEILYVLFTDCKIPKLVPNYIKSQKYIKRCSQIIDYIDNHYKDNLSLEQLADIFSLSKEHLSRTFKTYMDTTYKKYLTSIRIHHAYQDLIDSDLSILEIALDNGFSDARAFTNSFYTYYGETPLKYRKNNKYSKTSHVKHLYLRTHDYL